MNRPVIRLVKGDIVNVHTDVIVNSANETLLGDDGVDGAIHIAAGKELREYCATLGGCGVAEVKITPSFNLPHKHIYHTVGPQYENEEGSEAELLKLCYERCLSLADENNMNSISFPSISTGQYGYPIQEAATIALSTINDYLNNDRASLQEVIIVLYPSDEFNDHDTDDFNEYKHAASKLNIPVIY